MLATYWRPRKGKVGSLGQGEMRGSKAESVGWVQHQSKRGRLLIDIGAHVRLLEGMSWTGRPGCVSKLESRGKNLDVHDWK